MTELRASDADRDQVVDVLRVAAGDGRLTVDELEHAWWTEVNIPPGAKPGEPVMLRVRLTGGMRCGRIEERRRPRAPGQQQVTEGGQEQ